MYKQIYLDSSTSITISSFFFFLLSRQTNAKSLITFYMATFMRKKSNGTKARSEAEKTQTRERNSFIKNSRFFISAYSLPSLPHILSASFFFHRALPHIITAIPPKHPLSLSKKRVEGNEERKYTSLALLHANFPRTRVSLFNGCGDGA